MYINDLILAINSLGIGIQCDSDSALVYADDLILMAEKEQDLQKLLNSV